MILIVLFWGIAISAGNTAHLEPFVLEKLFLKHQANGALVLYRLSDGMRWVHNRNRANQLFIPASTFKIPHTIIAIDLGIVSSVDEIYPWDGNVRRISSWNRAQNLRQAMRNSTVPIYQSIARKIGMQRMKRKITELNYGNNEISGVIDEFWLKGPLRISPNQQIDFLKRLFNRTLPITKQSQDDTVEILLRDQGIGFVHRGKTGWEIQSNPAIGWYVGWHELKHDVVFFALNMDMTKKHHPKARIDIVREALDLITSTNR